MVVVYKEKKTAFMLNVAIPADISKKEHKKMDKKKVKVPGVKEQGTRNKEQLRRC